MEAGDAPDQAGPSRVDSSRSSPNDSQASSTDSELTRDRAGEEMELEPLCPSPREITRPRRRARPTRHQGLSPLHIAVVEEDIEALKKLINAGNIDLNRTSTLEGNTALMLAIENITYFFGCNPLMEIKKHYDMIEQLLMAGCDVNIPNNKGETPIYSALKQGLRTVVEMIKSHAHDPIEVLLKAVNCEKLLHAITRDISNFYCYIPKADFIWCLDLLFENSKFNINCVVVNGRTALHHIVLHHACLCRDEDDGIIMTLLRHGACVGTRDVFNESPLAQMNPKTLKTYMDECVTDWGSSSSEEYMIQIKFNFLVYQNHSNENNPHTAPETDALLYMSQREGLRPLLEHPVITTFLYLKWQSISGLAYANITFYFLMCLCLILYVIFGYSAEKNQSDSMKTLNIMTHIGAIIGLVLLIFREFFQLVLSPARYVRGFENWMEIALIFVIAWIVFYDSAQQSTKQQLSAVAILISSAELLLLIGQFPASSTNIEMLKTVSWNFLKFILWYSILIIAFALSFYTLFREVKQDQTTTSLHLNGTANNTKEEKGEDFFNDPFRALFKTIVMFTGEFDAGSMQFNTLPVTSHIIFIIFVFMIPIVLLNLLNGLAVSDTQEIRADAELVGLISRLKLISYIESLYLKAKATRLLPTECLSIHFLPIFIRTRVQSVMSRILNLKALFLESFEHYIYLLPRFDEGLTILPNKANKILMPKVRRLVRGESVWQLDRNCFGRSRKYYLDRNIVQKALNIISKKLNIPEHDESKTALLQYESKFEKLESEFESKFEKLETKIENLESKFESKFENLNTTLNKMLETLERMSSNQP